MHCSRFVLIAASAFLVLLGCSSEPAHIVLGKDWNPDKQVVYDTASSFHVNAPIMLQMYNGGEFGTDSIQLTVYQGTVADPSSKVYSRFIKVKPSESSLILKGRGGAAPLTARGLVGASAAGVYTLEFTLEGVVRASRQIDMTRSQEK